ncbi:hypothetical protein CASFOL_039148 [Castilleja foliolosa]|uniref:Myb-like domain-containing protein n=1 Tax=Castilleja foliolosa TaxID=1961234 RepID=A0ABD3BHL1_9LAMI
MDLTVGNNTLLRDYRKGNWNLQETMVLIEAKKMDDERRMSRRVGETTDRGKPAELRWKWVEDYCWKNGCLRSQNQCNDKWDNLMRDFKKIREYEKKIEEFNNNNKSYWRIEKNERKDNNLPSNMLPQIYEALVEVVERRGQKAAASGGAGGSPVVEKISGGGVLGGHQFPFLPAPVEKQYCDIVQAPQQPSPEIRGGAVPDSSQPVHTVDSDNSEYSGSPAKRRKRHGGSGGGGEGTSGGSANRTQELGLAISKSASTIAEAIQACEERRERRHREIMSVHERRLQIEESKAEINRNGINGLVDAINKLASSIFALAAHNSSPPPSK